MNTYNSNKLESCVDKIKESLNESTWDAVEKALSLTMKDLTIAPFYYYQTRNINR